MGRGERARVTSEGQISLPVDLKKEQQAQKARGGQQRSSPVAGVPTPSRGGGGRSPGSGRSPHGSALEDVMRRSGVDEAWGALEEMLRVSRTTAADKCTVSRMLMKTIREVHARTGAQQVYRAIGLVESYISAHPKDVDDILFNALLETCCRMKDMPRFEATVRRMRELGMTPSPITLGILVKTYGKAGDSQKVLQVWDEMEAQRGQANDVTYGCMIDACVKCGRLEKAVEIFQDMKSVGKHKNTVLYTTLIKGYGLEKDLPSALALFREMAEEKVPYNTITYNSILDACVKCGDLPTAEGVLQQMLAANFDPDLITFSTLLKGYCHASDLDKALKVVENIKARGLRCDELVYNTLMDGCVKAGDVEAGVGLFEEMISSGLRPSAITNSILTRLYQRAGCEDASEAVAQLFQHHGIERPPANESGSRRGLGAFSGDRGFASGGRPLHRSPTVSPSASESGWSAFGFDMMTRTEPMTPLATSPMPAAPSASSFAALAGCMPMAPPLPALSREVTPGSSAVASPMAHGSQFPSAWIGADGTAFGMAPPLPPSQTLAGPAPQQQVAYATAAGTCPASALPTFPFPAHGMGVAQPGAEMMQQVIAVPIPMVVGSEAELAQQQQQQQMHAAFAGMALPGLAQVGQPPFAMCTQMPMQTQAMTLQGMAMQPQMMQTAHAHGPPAMPQQAQQQAYFEQWGGFGGQGTHFFMG